MATVSLGANDRFGSIAVIGRRCWTHGPKTSACFSIQILHPFGWLSHALILLKDKLVGFALLNTRSHRGGTIERNMGEFFIARKHRRRGLATEAVRQILMTYPGRWEVAVVERNLAAKAFWPKAIAAAPNVSELIRLEGDGEHWRGPIWSFFAAKVQ